MTIRNITIADAANICHIYNYYVKHTAATFETEPVSIDEMKDRIAKVTGKGLPYYIIQEDEEIAGYTYLSIWNGRAAYDSTKEITIYLDHEKKGKGYGSQLYKFLLEKIDKKCIHSLIAIICIPNEASVQLHEKFGFRQVSHFREVGYKFNRWQDVGHWQLIF